MYNYVCEDCGREFQTTGKKQICLCDYCSRRRYNCKAHGKEYIPYLQRSLEEQKLIDKMLCRKMTKEEAKEYLAFRANQRKENNSPKLEVVDNTEQLQIDKPNEAIDILEALQNMSQIFYSYYDNLKAVREKLSQFEMLEIDNIHELELGAHTDEEILAISRKLQNNLKIRRVLKDKLDEMLLLKEFIDKHFHTNQIGKDIGILINKINDLRKNQETRSYSPRIDESLLDKSWTTNKMKYQPEQLPRRGLN